MTARDEKGSIWPTPRAHLHDRGPDSVSRSYSRTHPLAFSKQRKAQMQRLHILVTLLDVVNLVSVLVQLSSQKIRDQ